MRNLGRILLALAALLAAFVIGVLVGRNEEARPLSQTTEGGVQITTEDAPPAAVTEPLVAPVQAPPAAAVAPTTPDLQVQEDAAAVGMTTRDEPRQEPEEPTTPPDAPEESAPPAPGQ